MQSNGCTKTRDTYREKHLHRCYVLLECHKTIDAAKTFRCQGCDNTRSRPRTRNISPLLFYTLNHQVGVDVFEIIDPVGVRFSSDHDFSIIPYTSTSLRLRLVTSGWLVRNCSIRPRNARQRGIQFNSHQERCDDQTCWIGNAGTNQSNRTTR